MGHSLLGRTAKQSSMSHHKISVDIKNLEEAYPAAEPDAEQDARKRRVLLALLCSFIAVAIVGGSIMVTRRASRSKEGRSLERTEDLNRNQAKAAIDPKYDPKHDPKYDPKYNAAHE